MCSPIPRQTSRERTGEQHPGGAGSRRGKSGRDLLAVVIPHDGQIPIRIETISGSPLAALQRLVHGSFRAVRLGQPAATLYVNEEGIARGLPINPRAVMLGQAHRAMTLSGEPCDLRLLLGDVVLVGPLADDGRDASAPQEFLALFAHTGQFKIEVSVYGEPGRWHGNSLRFEDVSDAYAWGLSLARRWTSVQELRVVPVLPDMTPGEVPLPQGPDQHSGEENAQGQDEPS